MDENGYVMGWLPATKGMENVPVLGFISHMDTSPDASGKDIRPRVVEYHGGDVELGNGEVISLATFPFLYR